MVRDIYTGTSSSHPFELVGVNGWLFFVADDGVHGQELWVSDGTEAGPVMLADIHAGSGLRRPQGLTGTNNRLYFTADDLIHGTELWAVTVSHSTFLPLVLKAP